MNFRRLTHAFVSLSMNGISPIIHASLTAMDLSILDSHFPEHNALAKFKRHMNQLSLNV